MTAVSLQGCRVALDDVGAGYSSLTLLARVRPDVVTIDKALVQALPEPGAAAVVRALVTLAHDPGPRPPLSEDGARTPVSRPQPPKVS
jgi:EAL domain-containing protein (putative c-di-GMP-specific phosphodiesterase class I)